MHTDLPTLGAPVMIVGLLAGFFLCFYGNVAKKYLVPLRSVLSGAMVSLAVAFVILQKETLISALHAPRAAQALLDLLISRENYLFSIIALSSVAIGGLALFTLSRKPGVVIDKIVALFTALSMAMFIFLLLLGFLPLTYSLGFATLALVAILFLSMRDFASYIAFENSIGGGLLISYLLARFWYLDLWVFLTLTALFSVAGIFSQLRSLKKHRPKEEQSSE